MVMLSVNLGILVGYILSTYLAYHIVPFLAIILPIAYFVANLFLPETAPYLLRRSRLIAAEASFKYYKNRKLEFDTDFEDLRVAIDAQQLQNTTALSYKDLSKLPYKNCIYALKPLPIYILATKPALKAFAAAVVLSLGYQFSGVFSFINYMSDIFKASGSILDVNSCTIVIGVVQIVGVYTSTIFVDIIGRRILMLISTLGIGLGCTSFGFFTYYAQIYDLSDLNWIPLVLMILIIYLANIGLIGLFFVVLVELFPAKVGQYNTTLFCIKLKTQTRFYRYVLWLHPYLWYF